MQKIKDLRPGGKIELMAEIISIQPIRKLWQCFECKKAGKEVFEGLWKTEEEFKTECPTCGAKQIWRCLKCDKGDIILKDKNAELICDICNEELKPDKGKGLWIQDVTSALIKDDSGMTYLDLWKEQIGQFQIKDKIHIINGYAKKNSSGGVNVSSGKYGTLKKVEEKLEDKKMEFKKWTKEEVEKFCEDNWVEDSGWLYNYIKETEATIEMDDSENKEGNLVVVIKGKSNE